MATEPQDVGDTPLGLRNSPVVQASTGEDDKAPEPTTCGSDGTDDNYEER